MQRRSSGSSNGDIPLASPVNGGPPSPIESEWPRPAPSQQQPTKQQQLDSQTSADLRPSSARSRRPSNFNWRLSGPGNGSAAKISLIDKALLVTGPAARDHDLHTMEKSLESKLVGRRPRAWNPWAMGFLTLCVSLVGMSLLAAIVNSLATGQIEPKGCRMSYMAPSYAKLDEFDTEHTRFASKYSLYLYREQGIDVDTKVRHTTRERKRLSHIVVRRVLTIVCAAQGHSRSLRSRKRRELQTGSTDRC